MTDTIPLVDLVNLTVRIEKTQRDQLDRIAKQEDRSVSSAVRVLLNEAIKAREAK